MAKTVADGRPCSTAPIACGECAERYHIRPFAEPKFPVGGGGEPDGRAGGLRGDGLLMFEQLRTKYDIRTGTLRIYIFSVL